MRISRHAVIAALLFTSAASTTALASGPAATPKPVPTATQKKAAKALVTLSQLNLAVKEDWKFNGGGEVEGKVYVGRDALKTGGAETTQIGFGCAGHVGGCTGQSSAESGFATVTVGGKSDVGFQIKNAVGGSYGAYIVGNANREINVQDNGGTVKIGGNALSVKVKDNQTTWIGGSLTNQNGIDLANNGQLWVGGTLSKFQGGQNNSVKVHGSLSYGLVTQGSTLQVGGSIGGGQSAVGTTVTALGSISNFEGAGTVKAGGSIANGKIRGSGSNLYARGGVSNVSNETGNASAIHTGANVFSGAVTAPADPGIPTIGSLNSQTTTMFDNFAALQTVLRDLSTTGHAGSATCVNGNNVSVSCGIKLNNGQPGDNKIVATFNAVNTNGYSVINISENELRAESIKFNFSNATAPVIINVRNTGACALTMSCSYTTDSNMSGFNNPSFNRNVIWNFVDASSVVLNKQFQGSVVAALADLRANVVEGSVVAKNFTMTNEIHLGTFNRNEGNSFLLTGVVPEPANWVMMIAGFGMIGGAIRRRRKFAVAA